MFLSLIKYYNNFEESPDIITPIGLNLQTEKIDNVSS